MTSTQSRIAAAADRYGVPQSIALAVARAESGYNQSAVSSSGAIGVMQLMPATAAGLGVDPRDESQNIDGGVRLLSQLYSRYGDWSYSLAAYNAGPSRANQGPDFWPAETQAYVPRVLSYAGMPVPDPTPPYGSSDSWGADEAALEASLLGQPDASTIGLTLLAGAVALLLFTD
jgi:soluble lytic murein transglycosylase-like protein